MVNTDSPLKTIANAHQVSDAELAALALALEGLPTAEIATELGCSPDAVRKRLGQVYSKFKITGKGPGKLAALRYKLNQQLPPDRSVAIAPTRRSQSPRQDWGDAPRLSGFWGRQPEVATLKDWILQDRCPLIGLCGLVGVGKTSLAVDVAQQIQAEFDAIIWYSLRQMPSLNQALDDWLERLSADKPTHQNQTQGQQLTRLIQQFKKHRCLLILDDFESLFKPGQLAGKYQPNCQDYQPFLQQIRDTRHQSCVLVITQENPLELAYVIDEKSTPRILSVDGLKVADAQKIVESVLGSTVSIEDSTQLVQRYSGHPLAIKTAATTIRELFNGNIGQFLQQGLFLANGLTQAMEQQFQRLSSQENQILYDLALYQTAVNLQQLQSHFSSAGNPSDTLNALASLKRRSLLEIITESGEVKWTLQPMVKQYVIHQLREKMSQFISAHQPQEIDKREILTDLGIINLTLPEEAEEQQDQQLTYHQIAIHLNKMGQRQYLQGDFIRAKQYLTWAIEFYSNLSSAHYNLGSTYEELDDYDLARQHYQIAVKGSSNAAIFAQNNLARLDILAGHIDQAIHQMNAALERTTKPEWKIAIYKNLGWAYWVKQDYDLAEQYLQIALELDEKYASAHYLMAKVLDGKGEFEAAQQFWQNALNYDNWGKKQPNSAWRLPELEGWRAAAHQRLQ